MSVLRGVFFVLVIALFPVLVLFLIRLTLKLGRSLDHVNTMLEDVRPRFNQALNDLLNGMEAMNLQLERLNEMTLDLEKGISSFRSTAAHLEKAFSSPLVRAGGILGGWLSLSWVMRRAFNRR